MNNSAEFYEFTTGQSKYFTELLSTKYILHRLGSGLRLGLDWTKRGISFCYPGGVERIIETAFLCALQHPVSTCTALLLSHKVCSSNGNFSSLHFTSLHFTFDKQGD